MTTRNIAVPEELCRTLEQEFGNRYSSVEELVLSLLQEVLRDDAVKMDEAEQHIIEARLRGLGYV